MSKNAWKLVTNEEGAALIEAVFVLPLLIFMVIAALQFSITMNIYMTATSAAAAGLKVFDAYRGITGSYTAATNAATNAAKLSAWKIAASDISVSLWVNSSACSTDTACDAALTSNGPPGTGGPGSSTKFRFK
jgi:TadE-like protein